MTSTGTSSRLACTFVTCAAAAALLAGQGAITASPAAASSTVVTVSYVPNSQSYSVTPTSIQRSAGESFTLANTMSSADGQQSVYVSIVNGSGRASMGGTACERVNSCRVLDLFSGSATGSVTVIAPGTFTIMRVLRPVPTTPPAEPITVGTLTVTGTQPVDPALTITSSGRTTVGGKPGISIEGLAEGFRDNASVRVWFRFPGQTEYSEAAGRPSTTTNGTFTWQRKTGKKVYVYVTSMNTEIKSNRIIIPAR